MLLFKKGKSSNESTRTRAGTLTGSLKDKKRGKKGLLLNRRESMQLNFQEKLQQNASNANPKDGPNLWTFADEEQKRRLSIISNNFEISSYKSLDPIDSKNSNNFNNYRTEKNLGLDSRTNSHQKIGSANANNLHQSQKRYGNQSQNPSNNFPPSNRFLRDHYQMIPPEPNIYYTSLEQVAKDYFRRNPWGPTGRVQGIVFIEKNCPDKCDHLHMVAKPENHSHNQNQNQNKFQINKPQKQTKVTKHSTETHEVNLQKQPPNQKIETDPTPSKVVLPQETETTELDDGDFIELQNYLENNSNCSNVSFSVIDGSKVDESQKKRCLETDL